MSDLIDRQAAISEIMEDIKDRSLHDDPATPEDYAEGYDEGIRNAAAIVLQVPSVQPTCTNTVQVDDCISREAAIEALDKRFDSIPMEQTTEILSLRRDLRNLPSAQPEDRCGECDAWNQYKNYPQPRWIPCETALPEHDGEYLVTIKAFTPDQVVHTDIDIARFTDGKWRKGFPVTAWCELPKPWEGE